MRGLYACLLVWLMPISSTQDFTGLSNVTTDKTTCTVRPVSLTEETSLTCYFPEDVSVTKKDFTVYHYLDSKRPMSVLDCLWLSGRAECFTASGYEYNRLVSSQVTVRIPSVTLNQTGKYSCQISGSNPEDLEFCRLILTSGKTSCQVPVVEPTGDTNLTCYFPEDISLSRRDFAVYRFKDHESSELVVDCSWTVGEITCAVQRGYQVDTKISDRVTVNILQASQEQTGSYLCGFSSDRPDSSLSCSFQLKHLGNILLERRPQESGNNTVATTVVIIVLAITTSFLLLWVVLREFFWRRLRCSQTTQKSQDEENCTSRMKISHALCSCTPPLTDNDVDEGQHVQPVKRSRACEKQGPALSCPSRLLEWSRRLRGRVPRNQAEETGETVKPLLRNVSPKQSALEMTSDGNEICHQTVRSNHTETGEVGFTEPDLSSLKQTRADVVQSLHCVSVVTAAVADDDTMDEISNDRESKRIVSVDNSARTKNMKERSQPGDVYAADCEKSSTVIKIDINQETGKQGAQSASGTAHSLRETQPWTTSNANGENQSRDLKTETMGDTTDTRKESKLDMNLTPADHNTKMLEEGKRKDRKRPSSKKKRPVSYEGNKTNWKKREESNKTNSEKCDSSANDSDDALDVQIARERAEQVSQKQPKAKKSVSLLSRRKRPVSYEGNKTNWKKREESNKTNSEKCDSSANDSDDALDAQIARERAEQVSQKQPKAKKSVSLLSRRKKYEKDGNSTRSNRLSSHI